MSNELTINSTTNELAITVTDTPNARLILAAFLKAVADKDFMGSIKKINAAVDALTPKSHVTATFKRLQGNALSDYAVNKENKVQGYTDETKAGKIQEYVYDRFKSYMADPKNREEATKLFNAAYPPAVEELASAEISAD